MTVLLVTLGAAVGAPLRYLVGRSLPRTGILVVNVAGSFLLGLVGADNPLVGTGFCGALTTYSTFGADTVALARERRPAAATANVAANLILGLAAARLGGAL